MADLLNKFQKIRRSFSWEKIWDIIDDNFLRANQEINETNRHLDSVDSELSSHEKESSARFEGLDKTVFDNHQEILRKQSSHERLIDDKLARGKEAYDSFTESIDRKVTILSSNTTSKIRQVTDEFNQKVDALDTRTTESIISYKKAMSNALNTARTDMATQVSSAKQDFMETVSSNKTEFTRRLESEVSDLEEKISDLKKYSDSEDSRIRMSMQASNSIMDNRISAVSAGLSQANGRFDRDEAIIKRIQDSIPEEVSLLEQKMADGDSSIQRNLDERVSEGQAEISRLEREIREIEKKSDEADEKLKDMVSSQVLTQFSTEISDIQEQIATMGARTRIERFTAVQGQSAFYLSSEYPTGRNLLAVYRNGIRQWLNTGFKELSSNSLKLMEPCRDGEFIVAVYTLQYTLSDKTTDEFNNLLVQVEDAISRASEMAGKSESYAKLSKSYAVGNNGYRDGDESDNAKYYYERTREFYADISTVKADINVLKEKDSAFEENLSSLQDSVSRELRVLKETQVSNFSTLNQRISDGDSRLSNEISALTEKEQNSYNRLVERYEALSGRISSLSEKEFNDFSSIQQDLMALRTSVVSAKKEMSEAIESLKQGFDLPNSVWMELENRMDARLQAFRSSISSTLESMQDNISFLRDTIDGLDLSGTSVSEELKVLLNQRLSEVSEQNSQEIQQMKEDLQNSFNSSYRTLNSNMQNLSEDMNRKILALRSDINELKDSGGNQDLSEIRSILQEMSKQVSEIRSWNSIGN